MNPDIDDLTRLAARIMTIEDITSGDPGKGYLARYRGKLLKDSVEAYQELDETLKPYEVTPLFRLEGEQHVVLLQPGRIQTRPAKTWINLVMFGLTLASVIFVAALSYYEPVEGASVLEQVQGAILAGLPFAVSLLGILLAHELGHYFIGRLSGAPVTLPYFIPLPLPPFGTMGAVIQMQAPPRNKRSLLDIGIAGPLAGLLVAIPVLIYGLSLSTVSTIVPIAGGANQMEGNSLLYLLIKWVMFGEWLPQPASYNGAAPVLYWLRYFFSGTPFPWGGLDVIIHPVAFAGWAGLLVTSLNLIPVGQLDGGHILSALLGKKARKLLPFAIGATALLGFAWQGWWLWTALMLFFGRIYDEPLDQITQLDGKRKVLGVLGLILFILVFTPVPLVIVSTIP